MPRSEKKPTHLTQAVGIHSSPIVQLPQPPLRSFRTASAMSFLSSFVNASKIIAVTSTGILAGYSFGASFNTIPAITASDVSADKVVELWDNVFEIGKNFVMPVVTITSPLFFYIAYKRWHSPFVTPLGVSLGIDLTEGVQYAIAGGLLATIAPFTRFLMFPHSIKNMKHRVDVVKAAKVKGLEPILDHEAIWDDVNEWTRHNSIRTIIFTTTFFLGVTAL